ncbi:hypothetical protein AAMO2058_000161300 [Amorphochlora amoebiformis]
MTTNHPAMIAVLVCIADKYFTVPKSFILLQGLNPSDKIRDVKEKLLRVCPNLDQKHLGLRMAGGESTLQDKMSLENLKIKTEATFELIRNEEAAEAVTRGKEEEEKEQEEKEGRKKKPVVVYVPDFIEDVKYFVQLVPPLPREDIGHDAVIQAARFGNYWIRIRRPGISPSDLVAWMKTCESKKKAGVHIGIPQHLVTQALIGAMTTMGYKFYTYHERTNELCWYKWARIGVPDKVPKYATSIEGGGVIVLSPDEKKVLLVKERGRYLRAGGALDTGESCLDTALRECREETGVEIDPSFTPVVGIAYQQPASRDGTINDHFMLFVVKAKSTDLNLDTNEIQGAHWFDIHVMLDAWKEEQTKLKEEVKKAKGGIVAQPATVTVDGKVVGSMELLCMERYMTGKAHPIAYVYLSRTRRRPALFY